MKKRLLGSLLAALFVVGMMAPAAIASVNGVAAFSGVAAVGDDFASGCTKSGGNPTGEGIGLQPDDEPHSWSLSAPFTFVGSSQNSEPGVYNGTFNACGWMSGTAGQNEVGAACATTKGYGGVGQALVPGAWRVKLFNIQWKQAVGPVLAVTGNYEEYVGTSTVKKQKFGTFVALVAAAPTYPLPGPIPPTEVPCVNDTAENFDINGVAVLLNGGVYASKHDLPGDTKSCNGQGTPGNCPSPKNTPPVVFP